MACLLAAPTAKADDAVDLELVLAVDISMSMDLDEQRLQRSGYIAAMRDPNVIRAIQSGPQGRIALTYVEWAGNGIQSVVVPWRIVASQSDAHRFANELAIPPIRRQRRTSISSAIVFVSALFGKGGIKSLRRVIDVSGDGPNNAGETIVVAREKVLKKGIIINGLAIELNESRPGRFSYFDIEDLTSYYKDCVIGGPGAFALTIRDKSEFATAIRQKLLLEIAGPMPPPRVLRKAQSTTRPELIPVAGYGDGWQQLVVGDGVETGLGIQTVQLAPKRKPVDCQIGEKRWQQFWQGHE